MIETEIGFFIRASITGPVADVEGLRKAIQAVMPVIELPDLGFADMKRLKGGDLSLESFMLPNCRRGLCYSERRGVDTLSSRLPH